MNSRVFKEPLQDINEKYLQVDMKVKSIVNSITQILKDNKAKAVTVISKLDTLSPLKTLSRGYCIPSSNGKVIKSVKKIKKDEIINLRFEDGKVETKVI